MGELIKVGMADYKVAKNDDILITLGLGSCVGIVVYDKFKKVAGMAHIMLPSSKEIKNNSNKAKFADTGLDELMKDLLKLGVNKNMLKAKIAGGAQMFNITSNNDVLNIGKRNVLAVKEKLKNLNIEIVSEDVLGNFGRTIEFNCSNSELVIKAIGKGKKVI